MGLKTLLKSGVLLDIYFFKNNRASFLMSLLYPYLFLALIVGVGMMFGNIASFKRNVGLDVNPYVFFAASTVVAMSSLTVMWEVGGNVLFLRWVGALPYVVLAPHRFTTTLVLSYIPRYLLYVLIQVLEFIPLLVYFEGPIGLAKAGVMLLAVTVGMLPLLGFSAIFASLLLLTEEESNILNWLNPIILLLSGAFYPVTLLPYWAQLISRLLPTTYTFEFARLAALIGAPKIAPIVFLTSILLGLALAYNSLAYAFIGVSERKAMKKGVI